MVILGCVVPFSAPHAEPLLPWLAEDEPGALDVIQVRKHNLQNELFLSVGTLPVDPFYKGLTTSLGYALHLSDFVAVQVQGTYAFNFDTDLKDKVVQIDSVQGGDPPKFPEIAWVVAPYLVLKPLYGKEAWFNTEVIHVELFVQAGPAIVGRNHAGDGMALGVDAGFGARFWVHDDLSLRFDMGELIYAADGGVKQDLHLHLGVALNLELGD